MREENSTHTSPPKNDRMRSAAWESSGNLAMTYMRWAIRSWKFRSAWYWARVAFTAKKKAAELREHGL